MEVKKLLFVGDTVPNSSFSFGENLKKLCAGHDLRIFNLEGAFSNLRRPLFKSGPSLLLDEKFFAPITECFNVATLANNHSMDYCDEGLNATISVCKSSGIYTVGAGLNLDEAFTPLDFDNLRIISVAEQEFGAATKETAGIAIVEEQSKLFKSIVDGKTAGKYVVVVAHGGSEIIQIPPEYLRRRYKLWIDYGADLVIGGHPHVVQGNEIYKNRYIFYSLGNFCFLNWEDFLQYPDALWSIAVSVEILKNEIIVFAIRPNKIVGEDIIIDVSNNHSSDIGKFNILSDMINSENYQKMYKDIASKLYVDWYVGRIHDGDRDDAAFVLNLFRCDAHRNIIQTELSRRIKEHQ